MKQPTRFISSNNLKHYDVVNKKGQDMGQVQTFVIDMVAGRIAFVVVSFEGFLGISDKWFAMPWAILSWSTDNRNLFLICLKMSWKKLPGWTKTNGRITSILKWWLKLTVILVSPLIGIVLIQKDNFDSVKF